MPCTAINETTENGEPLISFGMNNLALPVADVELSSFAEVPTSANERAILNHAW